MFIASGIIASVFSVGFADSLSTATSGEINVDLLMARQQKYTRSLMAIESSESKQSAGGGTFWVEWGEKDGSQAYKSYYEHDTKTHMTTVKNRYHNSSSPWEAPGDLAETEWIYSAMNGNRAYWNTK